MGGKPSKVQQADVETGQMGTTGELTQGTGVMGLPQEANVHPDDVQAGVPVTVISTIPTAEIGQPIMAPTDGHCPQQEVKEDQHQQAQNERCCGNWKWCIWILFVLALPFIIAFFVLIFVIYIVFLLYGIDLLKCVKS